MRGGIKGKIINQYLMFPGRQKLPTIHSEAIQLAKIVFFRRSFESEIALPKLPKCLTISYLVCHLEEDFSRHFCNFDAEIQRSLQQQKIRKDQ